jgi:SMC interacting uncharacterized protein involved in chromosome segregation
MEEWITNSRYNNNTEGQQLSPEQVEQITAEVEQEKTRLRALKDELDALNQRIEQENIAVGAGDLVSEEENALRKRLLDAHRAEEALLHGVLNRLAGQERQNGDALRGLRARVVQDFGRLGRLLNGINEAVDAKVADYRRQLDAERQLLAGYQAEVHSFEQNTDRFAREIGIPLFQLAHERLDQVVLEADLGLVDVAWRRKMTETDRIRGLQDERSEQVRDLQTTLEEILKN